MVAPAIIAAGIGAAASIGSTLLQGMGSGGGKMSYNPITAPDINQMYGLGGILNNQAGNINDLLKQSFAGMLDAKQNVMQMGNMPTLDDNSLFELDNATKVYGQNMRLAQNNLNTSTAAQSNSLARQMALTGAPVGGAGSQSMFSSIAAKNQASLNEYQMQQSQQLLGFRQSLLQGVYDRMINQYNARMGLSSQQFNMGQSLFGNVYGAASDTINRQLQVAQYNSQAKSAADASGGGGGILGGLFK
jgi:hypothetical protein